MKILVTGSGGFIGYHLASNLANSIKNTIIGIDSVNSYYPTKIKKLRIKLLKKKIILLLKRLI